MNTEPKITDVMDDMMEYVIELCWKINVEFTSEDLSTGGLGPWCKSFQLRYSKGVIPKHFKYDAYISNNDVIDTIKGYGLDVDKFWVALCFIYDVAYDKTYNVRIMPLDLLDEAVNILKFIEENDNVDLVLHNDASNNITKSNSFKISSSYFTDVLKSFARNIIDKSEGEQVGVYYKLHGGKYFDQSDSHFIICFYNLFTDLFDVLKLPQLRAKKGGTVSYDKKLLISRLIYLCRISHDINYAADTATLKGILSKYKNRTTNIISQIYN